MVSTPEITAAAKVLAFDYESEYQKLHAKWEDEVGEYMSTWHAPLSFSPPAEPREKTNRDIAKLMLEAAEAKRQDQAKWGAVGRIQLPDGEWHNFILAPFSTLLQAQKAGEGFTHDPKSKTGEGGFRAAPLVNKPADAWDSIRPEHVDKHEWIRKQIETGMTGLMDPNLYNERGRW